jgi:hypothetical protein
LTGTGSGSGRRRVGNVVAFRRLVPLVVDDFAAAARQILIAVAGRLLGRIDAHTTAVAKQVPSRHGSSDETADSATL